MVPPIHDFSVHNRDDGDQPVVIGRASGKNLAVDFIFEDYDAAILGPMDNKFVAGVKLDRLSVSREASYQI